MSTARDFLKQPASYIAYFMTPAHVPSRIAAMFSVDDWANGLDRSPVLGYTESQYWLSSREPALRIGQGFDVHRLVPGRSLILGGEEIEYPKGLEGHSDADVLTHALIDAILGAAGLGDIGMHFPDTDPAFRDASSIGMLQAVCSKVSRLGWKVSNIDITVFAENPKLGPYRKAIVSNLADAVGIAVDRVNLKATTTERLGFIGRGEGIAASAVALLDGISGTGNKDDSDENCRRNHS